MSEPTARKAMAEFKALRLAHVEKKDYVCMDGIRRLSLVMTLKSDFKWFVGDQFKKLREGFKPDATTEEEDKEEAMKEKYPLEKGYSISNRMYDYTINRQITTIAAQSSGGYSSLYPSSYGYNNKPLSRGEISFTVDSSVEEEPSSRHHNRYWSPASGKWHCSNCKASGDKFYMEDTNCCMK